MLSPVLALALAVSSGEPAIVSVCAVRTDTLAVTIDHGAFRTSPLQRYLPQPGDSIRPTSAKERFLYRNNVRVGGIAGVNNEFVRFFDAVVKPPFAAATLDDPRSWSIARPAGAAVSPTAVHRKSKPRDVRRIAGEWSYATVDRHIVYLTLPAPLTAGEDHLISVAGLTASYRHGEAVTEAVHVNHLGFRPDDPSKHAFLSCWTGAGGGLIYNAGDPFEVIDLGTGAVAFRGTLPPPRDPSAGEDAYNTNFTRAPVYVLDFSALSAPGEYRVRVPGIGVSLPFSIGHGPTWQRAFRSAARGFYHQRSGTELGPPHTNYTRPRPYHPEDGLAVYQSNTPFITPNPADSDQGEVFKRLVANVTGTVVPNAWGGYFDAGDWDRHIHHLKASRAMLLLYELNPDYFSRTRLNIPASVPRLPDLLEEALWTVEFFERLQTAEGGVRGGIEAEEHPRFPETSWLESLKVMAFAPDMASTWLYAASAAAGSRNIEAFDRGRASRLLDSAKRAMAWAEEQYRAWTGPTLPHSYKDARNLAAVELFRATGDAAYHTLFLDTTAFTSSGKELDEWQKHDQPEAAVAYLLEKKRQRDSAVVANCLAAVRRSADVRRTQSERTAFQWTKNPWAPTGWGVLGSPQAEYLVYGHAFTGDAEYLKATLNAAQFALGANPSNMTFTTGLGHAFPEHPLIVDTDITNHPNPPEGIVLYGPVDPAGYGAANGNAPWSYSLWRQAIQPAFPEWPAVENFVNLGILDANSNEYTVHQSMPSAMFVWGYLAARGRTAPEPDAAAAPASERRPGNIGRPR